jgi:hypothetical protein
MKLLMGATLVTLTITYGGIAAIYLLPVSNNIVGPCVIALLIGWAAFAVRWTNSQLND